MSQGLVSLTPPTLATQFDDLDGDKTDMVAETHLIKRPDCSV